MIAIIDYDAGNIKSVEKAVQYLGKEVSVTRYPEEILRADHVILPVSPCALIVAFAVLSKLKVTMLLFILADAASALSAVSPIKAAVKINVNTSTSARFFFPILFVILIILS